MGKKVSHYFFEEHQRFVFVMETVTEMILIKGTENIQTVVHNSWTA